MNQPRRSQVRLRPLEILDKLNIGRHPRDMDEAASKDSVDWLQDRLQGLRAFGFPEAKLSDTRYSGDASAETRSQRRKRGQSMVPGNLAEEFAGSSRILHRPSLYEEGSMNNRRKRKVKRPDLVRKFKAASWMSVIIRRLCAAHLRNTEDHDSPYMRDIKFVEKMTDTSETPTLLFDVGLFKANREVRMSEESKRIMRLPTWARTESELLHVQIALRTIADYAAYPVTTQRQIAEIGQYVKYEARRIIVREGHPAWNFYFILSGAVVVMVLDEDRKYVLPKAVLKRGHSFGDLALISGNPRSSTVAATEDVEMVSIWHEDFKRIFDNGGIKKSEDEFLKNLSFLHEWPLQVADENPQKFMYHYYKRGEVVIKDSSYSVWIIVVKAGSLNVLKKLKHVDAFEGLVKKSRRENPLQTKKKWQRHLKPLVATREHWTSNHPGLAKKALLQTPSKKEGPEETEAEQVATKEAMPPTIRYPSAIKEEDVVSKAIQDVKDLSEAPFKQEIRTAAGDLDKGYEEKDMQQLTEADIRPMFVHVRTLTKGHAFGLYDLLLGPQPSFSVISNGAECILIDKVLYAKHLSEKLQKDLRNEAQAFPGDDEMQRNLQISVDWEAYKGLTINQTLKASRRHRRELRSSQQC